MEYLLIYLFNEEEKEIEVFVDYSSGYDGIGHYEYWGSKEYDKGNLCIDLNEMTYNREGLSHEEVTAIEAAILNEESEIIDACLQDIADKKDAAEEAKYESYRDSLLD